MALSALDDKARKPTDADVEGVLGAKSKKLWDELRRRVAAVYIPLEEEWTFAGKNYGWSLRLKRKKRAILYMTPLRGAFRASLALGEKAVAAAREAGLPERAMKTIDEAPRYAEGRGVRFEVRAAKDLDLIEAVAAIKMAN